MSTKIISFHSYKGGSCRSTTCFNTVPYLADALGASADRPLILVDADIDSMGMTLLLTDENSNTFKDFSAKKVFSGDLRPSKEFKSIQKIEDNKFYNQFIPVGGKFGKENDTIRFLGVDKNESGSNIGGNPSRSTDPLTDVLEPLMRDFGGEFKGASAIIFDCASGIQHTASLANKISDVIVMCLRPSLQFRTSTFYYLNKKFPGIRNTGAAGDCRIVILPTAVPGEENITSSVAARMRRSAQAEITDYCHQTQKNHWREYPNLCLCDDMINDQSFGIPEVQRFKLEEGILYNIKSGDDEPSDEKRARESYKKLAASIIKG